VIRMRPILAKGTGIDTRKLQRAIDNGLDAAARGALVDFHVTTQTWKHQPEFRIESSPGRRLIYTDDEIYGWVDAGTRPHIIRPKGNKPLAFRYPFKAKTVPRQIRSRKGSYGKNWARAKWVLHPGTFAREFTDVIHLKWAKELPRTLQRAIDAEVI